MESLLSSAPATIAKGPIMAVPTPPRATKAARTDDGVASLGFSLCFASDDGDNETASVAAPRENIADSINHLKHLSRPANAFEAGVRAMHGGLRGSLMGTSAGAPLNFLGRRRKSRGREPVDAPHFMESYNVCLSLNHTWINNHSPPLLPVARAHHRHRQRADGPCGAVCGVPGR